MHAISVHSIGRIMLAAALGSLLASASHAGAASSDEIRAYSPSTTFKIGKITIRNVSAPDLTGEYKLPGLNGSSALLSIVQDRAGKLVGTATLKLGNKSYGPVELNGLLTASCAN